MISLYSPNGVEGRVHSRQTRHLADSYYRDQGGDESIFNSDRAVEIISDNYSKYLCLDKNRVKDHFSLADACENL